MVSNLQCLSKSKRISNNQDCESISIQKILISLCSCVKVASCRAIEESLKHLIGLNRLMKINRALKFSYEQSLVSSYTCYYRF